MSDLDKLYKLRDIAIKNALIGSPDKDNALSLSKELEYSIKEKENEKSRSVILSSKLENANRKILSLREELQHSNNKINLLKEEIKNGDTINPKTWVTIKDAVEYYGLSTQTIHNWRRQGKLQSRPTLYGKRKGFQYYLDPHIKEEIEERRKKDKRLL